MTGMLVERDVFTRAEVEHWRAAVPARERAENAFNPVAVALPEALRAIARHHRLARSMREILGTAPGIYNERLVVKDRFSRAPVFLHQDSVYHVGMMRKWSAFVALSEVTRENGGLIVYPGTEKFGSLGDAGEIDRSLAEEFQPECPEMQPGDVLFMKSEMWHESGPHISGPDRILVDIIFQPATDPFCIGRWPREQLRTAPLVRSRVSRIQELEAEVARLKGAAHA